MRLPTSTFLLTSCSVLGSLVMGGCAATQLTPAEAELVESMSPEKFQPATREMRDNIETQPLLSQATFWQREYELNPGDLESAIKLAAAVRRMGNPERAVEITQTTRALYPKDPYLIAEYAAALVASERGAQALPVLDKAVRTTPGYARLWSLRGASLDQAERYEDARKSYERALAITPYDANVLANMGLSYALEGDAATAEQWLVKAVAVPGASESVTRNLDLVRQLQGKGPTPAASRAASAPPPPLAGPAAGPASAMARQAGSQQAGSQPAGNFQVFSDGEARTAADAARMMARRSGTRTVVAPLPASPQSASARSAAPGAVMARPGTQPVARRTAPRNTLPRPPVQAADPNALDRIARNASPARRAVIQNRQRQRQQAVGQMQAPQQGLAPQSPFAPRPTQAGYAQPGRMQPGQVQPGYAQPYPQPRPQLRPYIPAQGYQQGYAQPGSSQSGQNQPLQGQPMVRPQGYPAGYPQGAAPYAVQPSGPRQVSGTAPGQARPGTQAVPRGRARGR